jgi:glycosyltransferase involved in cell wall biosynthesis
MSDATPQRTAHHPARLGDLPLVSVVLASYGRPQLLAQAIDSVLRQTHQHLELIISDDPAAKSCAGLLNELKDPRCKVQIHSERMGCWRNWTHAIQRARGDYLVFLGDDDWLSDSFIACHLEAFQKTPEATVSFCPVQEVHPDGSPLRIIETALAPWQPITGMRFLEVVLNQKVFFGGALFRRFPTVDIWNQTEPDDVVADHGLLLRMAAIEPLTCTIAPGACYNKTMHANQLSSRFLDVTRLHLELMHRVRKLPRLPSIREELDRNTTQVGIMLARHHAAMGEQRATRRILFDLLRVTPTLPTLWSQLFQSWLFPGRLRHTAQQQRGMGR